MPKESPEADSPAVSQVHEKDPLRRSRTSHTWLSLVVLGVGLVLLIVFIAQNTQRVHVSFFGWDTNPPLAVALLIAAVASLIITAVAGSLRIVQLRRRVRHQPSE